MLGLGRLINKKLDRLFEYYFELKNGLKNFSKTIDLHIIGDGPLNSFVSKHVKKDKDIHWLGAVIDESVIGGHIAKINYIFNPGHTGLHVNHHALGRPYITIKSHTRSRWIFRKWI